MFDLITIGDSVVDTYVELREAQLQVIGGQRMLALKWGDKVAVDPFVNVVGGNAANSAVGGARLKLKTAIYTNVGDDHNKHIILNQFKEEKVDTRYVVVSQEFPTDHHIILNFKDDRTILTYHQPWQYNLPDLEVTKWVYFTSLSPHFPETDLVAQLMQYLERTGAKLTYNPGTFQIKYGVKKFPKLLSLTEVLIVNKEEAKLILGYSETDKIPPKKLLKGLADLGPRLVVVTDGDVGSYGLDGEQYYHLGVFPSKVLQKTGAGDAYATALSAGLIHGKDLPEAMRWGGANGAAVVEGMGPQATLLSYDRMQAVLKEHQKIIAKEI